MSITTQELPISVTEYQLMSPDEQMKVAALGHSIVESQIDTSHVDDSALADRIAAASGCTFEAATLIALSFRYPNDEK